jgi:hypothetical protein
MNVYGFYADGIYEWGFSKNEIIERVHNDTKYTYSSEICSII